MDPLNNGLTNVASTPFVKPSSNNSAYNVTAIRPLPDKAPSESNLADLTSKVSDGQAIKKTQQEAQPQDSKQQLDAALKNVNDFFQIAKHTLQFSLNKDSGKMIVEIKDEKTGKVIRQIPSEEVLELAKRLDDLKGLLFSQSA